MGLYCKYHPSEQARWYCPEDGIHFCDHCVAVDEAQEGVARSFLSNKPVQWVGRRQADQPFWTLTGYFVAFPFQRAVLPVVAAVMVPALLFGFLMPDSLEGALLAALFNLPAASFGALLLRAAAENKDGIPAFKEMLLPAPIVLGLQLWLPVVALGVASGYGFWQLGMLQGALLTLVLWLVALPLVMLVFVYGGLAAVLKAPGDWLNVPFSLKAEYPLAVLMCAAFHWVAAFVAAIWLDLLPAWAGWPLAAASGALGWFGICHLLGYLVCRYQEALGYESDDMKKQAARRRRTLKPEEERRQIALIREGRYDRVLKQARSRLERQKESLPAHEQYERLLLALGRPEEILPLAEHYLALMYKNQQLERALLTFMKLRTLDARFRPESPNLCWELAQQALLQDQPKLVVALLQDMHVRAPTWPQVAEAYLLLAKVLHQHFQAPAKAEQYIRFVETKFRDYRIKDLAHKTREELGTAQAPEADDPA